MYALFYLDYVKCAHEGTRRMRDVMNEANLPDPEFAQKEVLTSQVHVTLKNNYEARKTFVDAEAARFVGVDMMEKLDGKDKVIVNFVAERGEISVSDANRILRCDWRTARNILDKLCEKGVMKRVSSGKQRDSRARYVLVARTESENEEG